MWKKFMGFSWKTSAVGYLTAAGTVLLPILQNGQLPTKNQVFAAIGFALLGRFSKDHDQTGKAN